MCRGKSLHHLNLALTSIMHASPKHKWEVVHPSSRKASATQRSVSTGMCRLSMVGGGVRGGRTGGRVCEGDKRGTKLVAMATAVSYPPPGHYLPHRAAQTWPTDVAGARLSSLIAVSVPALDTWEPVPALLHHSAGLSLGCSTMFSVGVPFPFKLCLNLNLGLGLNRALWLATHLGDELQKWIQWLCAVLGAKANIPFHCLSLCYDPSNLEGHFSSLHFPCNFVNIKLPYTWCLERRQPLQLLGCSIRRMSIMTLHTTCD